MKRTGMICIAERYSAWALVGRPLSVRLGGHWPESLGRLAAVVALLVSLPCAGCRQPEADVTGPSDRSARRETRQVAQRPSTGIPMGFAPAKITILPLTEWTGTSDGVQGTKLNIYVALSDAFGSNMKGPGVFRFELYERVSRSAEPKGQRLAIWPDIDLTGPDENHTYWRDFLRAYEFSLDTQADPDDTHILEATCMYPDGRRLSAEFTLKPGG